MDKKRIYVASFLGLLGILVLGFFLLTQKSSVDISEIGWETNPGFLVFPEIERNNTEGLLLVRMIDGIDEFLPGSWGVDFGKNNQAYVYGRTPETEEGHSIIHAFNPDRNVERMDIHSKDLDIINIKESGDGSYISARAENIDSLSFCIGTFKGRNESDCGKIYHQPSTLAAWNPDKDREFIFMNENDVVNVFDPWEEKPLVVSETNETERYNKLKEIVIADQEAKSGSISINQFGPFVVTRKNGSYAIHRFNFGAKVAQIHDNSHLVIKNEDSIDIYNIENRKYARYIDEKDIGKAKISFYNSVGKQEL